uniref:Uncharacterized protein n=1 Tax=Salix viminalis TaxID=40686 RepID=A0A6N2KT09_SALVM
MWPGARRRRRREKEGEPNLKGPAQPERPRPTGAVDEEEGKGPYHLAEKGKRPMHHPIQWKLYLNLSEVTRMIKLSSN